MKDTILPIAIIILIAGVAYAAYTTAQQAIRVQAVDGCLHAGTARFKNDKDVDVQVPDDYSYNLCMKRKGIK